MLAMINSSRYHGSRRERSLDLPRRIRGFKGQVGAASWEMARLPPVPSTRRSTGSGGEVPARDRRGRQYGLLLDPTDRQYACTDLVDRAVGLPESPDIVAMAPILMSCNLRRSGAPRAVGRGAADHHPRQSPPPHGSGEHDDASYVPAMRKSAVAGDCLESGAAARCGTRLGR